MNKLISLLFILACALSFSSCDTEEKVTFIPIGGGAHNSAGDLAAYAADGVSFLMVYVPGGRFPTGTDEQTLPDEDGANPQAVRVPYWMAETEVSYQLWDAVYDWAVLNGYTFANPGVQGGATEIGPIRTNRHPVTTINWRDAMVWCNALTEWYNANNGNKPDLDCVYYTDANYTIPLRASTNEDDDTSPPDDILDNSLVAGSEDFPYIKASSNGNTDMAHCTAKGFRLPTSMEWECAARYRDGTTWTPGNFASGATADYHDSAASSLVAVYGASSTSVVKSRKANALGLYDMSGNVYEWCFEWYTLSIGYARVIRAGCWFEGFYNLPVGDVAGEATYAVGNGIGFRIARTED